MIGKLSDWEDTIVALATPPGVGALGLIRLSGIKAFDIANLLFPSKDLSKQSSHTLHVGLLKHEGRVIDQVVVSLYKAPHSYTGEDVIEITAHGSGFVLQEIIEACVALGARLAKPGEFTQRAFLKGKMDLTQAEAVADLIASNTEAASQTALRTMRGGFSEELKALREKLIQFSALIELELDFATEDVEFADRKQFHQLIDEADLMVARLLQSFRMGNVIRNGVSVAIVGKPNAGKSTLLNTLLNENRAIVSEIPGTTRDTIEEVLNIEGILFRLIDTAGIRESEDQIERIGVERSRAKMLEAQIVLYLFDVNTESREELEQLGRGGFSSGEISVAHPLEAPIISSHSIDQPLQNSSRSGVEAIATSENSLNDLGYKAGSALSNLAESLGDAPNEVNNQAEGVPVSDSRMANGQKSPSTLLLVANKVDILEDATRDKFKELNVVYISALNGAFIEGLRNRLVDEVVGGRINTENTIITNARHFTALQQVARSLADIRSGLAAHLSGDLLTPDIHRTLHFLGEITGEITNEDQLDYIFSKFCVGK